MDALDEFFRVWCEPQAWCDRCKDYPAIHIVVPGNEETYDSIVTYVHVWDPSTQAHTALCRRCNKHHTDALGSQKFRYAPQVYQQSQPPYRQNGHQDMCYQWLRHLQRRVRRFLTWLVFFWRDQKPSRARVETKSYSRTGI